MNVQQLRTFVAVVDAGNFSAAARGLGISQPAVTMQIQSLESELGSALFERRYRRTDLTEAGRALMPVARRVLAELESVREDIAALEGQITGHLVIAASTTPGVYVIPRLLGGFLADHPRVQLTLLVADSADVVGQVADGKASLGFTGAEVKAGRVDFERVGTDELVVIAPSGSDLGTRRVALGEMARERWVARERGSGTRQASEEILARLGVNVGDMDVIVELGSGEAVVAAVEGGLGIAIVSRLTAGRSLALGSVVELDVQGFPASRPLYAVMPKGGLSPASGAFLEYVGSRIGRA